MTDTVVYSKLNEAMLMYSRKLIKKTYMPLKDNIFTQHKEQEFYDKLMSYADLAYKNYINTDNPFWHSKYEAYILATDLYNAQMALYGVNIEVKESAEKRALNEDMMKELKEESVKEINSQRENYGL